MVSSRAAGCYATGTFLHLHVKYSSCGDRTAATIADVTSRPQDWRENHPRLIWSPVTMQTTSGERLRGSLSTALSQCVCVCVCVWLTRPPQDEFALIPFIQDGGRWTEAFSGVWVWLNTVRRLQLLRGDVLLLKSHGDDIYIFLTRAGGVEALYSQRTRRSARLNHKFWWLLEKRKLWL